MGILTSSLNFTFTNLSGVELVFDKFGQTFEFVRVPGIIIGHRLFVFRNLLLELAVLLLEITQLIHQTGIIRGTS